MLPDYSNIRGLTEREPDWHDGRGVPRCHVQGWSVYRLQGWLDRVTYKPGVLVTAVEVSDRSLGIRVARRVPDRSNLAVHVLQSRQVAIPSYWDALSDRNRLSIVAWIVEQMEVHESREWLQFDGVLVNDPHGEAASE